VKGRGLSGENYHNKGGKGGEKNSSAYRTNSAPVKRDKKPVKGGELSIVWEGEILRMVLG